MPLPMFAKMILSINYMLSETEKRTNYMVRCDKCDEEMFTATISTQIPSSIPVMLVNRKERSFNSAKTELLCYVCPKCGRVELYAKDPKALKIRE